MKRILEKSGAGDVAVNSRILNVFKKKISVLLYCKRLFDMRARQEENHWQSCCTDGKPDRNINSKFTVSSEVEVQKLKTQKILRGQTRALF